MAMTTDRSIIRWLLLFCLWSFFLDSAEIKGKKPIVQTKETKQGYKQSKKGSKKVKQEKVSEQKVLCITKRRKKRKKRKTAQSKADKKTISTMNFEGLKKSKNEQVTIGNKDTAIKYLEKMIPLCTDMHELEKIMIELGDFYYETGRLTKSFTMYREFVNLYPGSEKVEYALYRTIICKFDEIYDAERDQAPTRETIKLADEFLERADVFVTHKDKVEEIRKKCWNRLFENELTIFNFYLCNKRIISATKRLKLIKEEFKSLIPELEPRIILLEVELAEAQNNNKLVEQKQSELLEKFPDYVTRVASATTLKKHFATRF
ncbi:outer membrane protein assembly factor BamD [Candidatus Dependentiae bacterium]|nr:MAG: outer membrane protein assembly factor BamD [Candidatus Dependentiae bacterium]